MGNVVDVAVVYAVFGTGEGLAIAPTDRDANSVCVRDVATLHTVMCATVYENARVADVAEGASCNLNVCATFYDNAIAGCVFEGDVLKCDVLCVGECE